MSATTQDAPQSMDDALTATLAELTPETVAEQPAREDQPVPTEGQTTPAATEQTEEVEQTTAEATDWKAETERARQELAEAKRREESYRGNLTQAQRLIQQANAEREALAQRLGQTDEQRKAEREAQYADWDRQIAAMPDERDRLAAARWVAGEKSMHQAQDLKAETERQQAQLQPVLEQLRQQQAAATVERNVQTFMQDFDREGVPALAAQTSVAEKDIRAYLSRPAEQQRFRDALILTNTTGTKVWENYAMSLHDHFKEIAEHQAAKRQSDLAANRAAQEGATRGDITGTAGVGKDDPKTLSDAKAALIEAFA